MINQDNIELRPKTFEEYIGQKQVVDNLKIFIDAAKSRDEVLDHILFYGSQGLGKTTIANIVANEMNSNFKSIIAVNIDKPKDLINILVLLEPGDTLFIDEIHRLSKSCMEVLYSALEDYYVDIIYGQNNNLKTIRVDLHPFTLIGATTKINMISKPLKDRFGIISRLDYYTNSDITKVIKRTSIVYNTSIEKKAIDYIASRSRNTPRIANNLFKRVRDFAYVLNNRHISLKICINAFKNLGINDEGLDEIDILYLDTIINMFDKGPCGIKSLSISLNIDIETLQDIYEPFLIKKGFIIKTSKGRIITKKGISYYNNINNTKTI